MLQIDDMTYRIAGRTLLDGATVSIPAGYKVGLVGPNGAGKTSLLRLITGEQSPDIGNLEVRRGARIGIVAQEAPGGSKSLLETVLAADTERASLLEESESATDPDRISEIHTRLADIGAHSAPSRAAAILAGLGFDQAAQERPCSEYSGGWRMRVAIASVLFSEPDLMLLDEPTNHLDLEATMWLEGYLRSYPHTVLIVSHDRDLLNRSVGHILHLDQGKLVLYSGGYDKFEAARIEKQAQQRKLQEKQEAQRQHIQAFVDRFRYKASKARQAQSRLKMLARMQPVASLVDQRTPSFRFPEPVSLAPPLATFDDVAVGYEEDNPVLSGLNLRIDPDDRIALLGPNGNGKSTFAKLLAGRLQPMAGRVVAPSKLKTGYFAQHQLDELTFGDTALDHMRRLMPDAMISAVRARLGPFGLAQEKADVPVESLSGGEKARLLLALMSHAAPQVLILDEPTNHLDIDAREALVHAVSDYPGAVLLISHDPHLVGLIAERLWLVADGTVKTFDGDLDDYRQFLLEQRRAAGRENGKTAPKQNRKEQRRAAAQARAALSSMRTQAKQAEADLKRLEAEKQKVQALLADPEVYDGPSDRVVELTRKSGELSAAIEAAEKLWLEAQEVLEAAD